MRKAADVALPELICAGKRLTAPDLLRNVPEFYRVNPGCLDDAAKPLFQVIDFNDVTGLIAAVAIFPVGLAVVSNSVGCIAQLCMMLR